MNLRNRTEPVVDRRAFCGSIAALTVGAAVALPLAAAPADTEFVIVNGWVLTRADLDEIGIRR